jgi:hypothetical protein
MASNVLKQFLIGIGFDTRDFDKGTRKIESGVGSMKSGILSASAAIVGAFGAAAASALTTANKIDQVALRASNLKTSLNFINAFGGALRLAGGDAGAAIDQIEGIEDALRALKLQGEFSPFAQAVPAGIDVLPLTQAKDAEEFLRLLAPQLQGLDEFGRRQVGEALGLDDAALRVLTEGLDTYVERAREATGDIEDLAEGSRKLNANLAELGLTFDGLQNELARDFIPAMAEAAEGVTEFTRGLRSILRGEGPVGQAYEAAGPVGALGAALKGTRGEPVSQTLIGAGLAERAIRKTAETEEGKDSLLRLLIPGYGATVDFFRGDSASEIQQSGTPQVQIITAEEDRAATAKAIGEAVSNRPIQVQNTVKVELDGEKFDKRVETVTERAAYNALEDLQQTTGR